MKIKIGDIEVNVEKLSILSNSYDEEQKTHKQMTNAGFIFTHCDVSRNFVLSQFIDLECNHIWKENQ